MSPKKKDVPAMSSGSARNINNPAKIMIGTAVANPQTSQSEDNSPSSSATRGGAYSSSPGDEFLVVAGDEYDPESSTPEY